MTVEEGTAAAPSTAAAHRRRRSATHRRAAEIVGSRWFLAAVLVAFTVQAAWIALLSRRSVYDEEYHLAAIDIYSQGWSPVIRAQPEDTIVGDVERYPSFLYHYVMSFPWRWTEGLGDGARVLVIRLLSVLLVTLGLWVWRGVVRQLGGSAAVANLATLAVAATPLLLFVASSVNYDNLLFLLTAAFVSVALRLYQKDTVDVSLWMQLLVYGGLASVTKFPFLPLGFGLLALVLVRQVAVVREHGLADSVTGWAATSTGERVRRWALLLLVVVVVGLVLERHVGNLVRFGTPLPDCSDVQALETCRQWGPWGRNERLDAASPDVPLSPSSALAYLSGTWLPQMFWQASTIGVLSAERAPILTNGPHVLSVVVAWGIPAVAAVLVLSVPALWRRRGAIPLLVVAVGYVGVLFAQNLVDYVRLGQAVGVHSRYVLVVLPIFVGAAFVGASRLLGEAYRWKVTLTCALLVVLTQGGGALQFLYQTDESWWEAPAGLLAVQERLGRLADAVVLPDDLVREARVDPKAVG